MEPIYEKAVASNTSIKRMLIDSFFKTHISQASKPEATIKPVDTQLSSEDQRLSRSHSTSLLFQPKAPKVSSRPNSVCSTSSNPLATSAFYDPSVPSTYSISIRNITLKKIQLMQRAVRDDNILCLIYSFLILLEDSEKNFNISPGIKIMKSKVWPTFEKYLLKPGEMVQVIRKMPKLVQDHTISVENAKKAQGLFEAVETRKLGIYTPIYQFLKETFGFIQECYGLGVEAISIKYPEGILKAAKPEVRSVKRNVSAQFEGSENRFENRLAEKVVKFKDLKPYRTASVTDNYPAEINSIARTNQSNALNELMKKPICLYKPVTSTSNKNVDRSKQKMKADKFMMDSRINRRIHDKFASFIKGLKNSEITANEGLSQAVVNEFIRTLPCAEVSNSSLKYIEHLTKTKEFEKLISNKNQ